MQEITFERLLDVINKFGEVAKRSVEAGFDFLEFHCAHNYLPHSMFSSGINHRSNEWGGSFENQYQIKLSQLSLYADKMYIHTSSLLLR